MTSDCPAFLVDLVMICLLGAAGACFCAPIAVNVADWMLFFLAVVVRCLDLAPFLLAVPTVPAVADLLSLPERAEAGNSDGMVMLSTCGPLSL